MGNDRPHENMMFHDVPWCSIMFHDVPWCSMMFQSTALISAPITLALSSRAIRWFKIAMETLAKLVPWFTYSNMWFSIAPKIQENHHEFGHLFCCAIIHKFLCNCVLYHLRYVIMASLRCPAKGLVSAAGQQNTSIYPMRMQKDFKKTPN